MDADEWHLGRADWIWVEDLGCHVPSCTRQVLRMHVDGDYHDRCGNGPLSGEQIDAGDCGLHDDSPDDTKPPADILWPYTRPHPDLDEAASALADIDGLLSPEALERTIISTASHFEFTPDDLCRRVAELRSEDA